MAAKLTTGLGWAIYLEAAYNIYLSRGGDLGREAWFQVFRIRALTSEGTMNHAMEYLETWPQATRRLRHLRELGYQVNATDIGKVGVVLHVYRGENVDVSLRPISQWLQGTLELGNATLS